MKFIRGLLTIVLLLPTCIFAAVPGEVNFQGVLLDNSNQLVHGSIDFDFALFDAPTGGTQLWSESQAGVSVVNGAYSAALGSVTPLTTGILSGSAVYLEITVDGEILSPRQRLLAVPYALEAKDAANLAGISGGVFQQLYQHVSYDGNSIPNSDPREGLADPDGDGRANFIDSDNDNDGISDATEDSNGTDINLITPIISTITGPWASTNSPLPRSGEPNAVTITGNNFLSGFTVQVGPENPIPQNVTGTSFDITVGTNQVEGSVPVTITLPNTETAISSLTFDLVTPTIASITGPWQTTYIPPLPAAGTPNLVTVTGTNFDPGFTVQVGSENPVPQNATSTSFDITVGATQAAGTVPFTITNPNAETATSSLTFDLVTPTITSFTGPWQTTNTPPLPVPGEPSLVTVTGTNFVSGFTVQVGSENPVPQNITSTSFDITIGTNQVDGPVPVTVTNPNGEAVSSPITFSERHNLVFVTSVTHANGLAQNVATADAFCAQLATDAGLTDTFIAWYSDTSSGISAKDRLPVDAIWQRTDGVVVATDIADLIDGTIAVAIDRDEYGNTPSVSNLVATHTFSDGTVNLNSCSGTSPTQGTYGRDNVTNSRWTDEGLLDCNSNYRYYCIQP